MDKWSAIIKEYESDKDLKLSGKEFAEIRDDFKKMCSSIAKKKYTVDNIDEIVDTVMEDVDAMDDNESYKHFLGYYMWRYANLMCEYEKFSNKKEAKSFKAYDVFCLNDDDFKDYIVEYATQTKSDIDIEYYVVTDLYRDRGKSMFGKNRRAEGSLIGIKGKDLPFKSFKLNDKYPPVTLYCADNLISSTKIGIITIAKIKLDPFTFTYKQSGIVYNIKDEHIQESEPWTTDKSVKDLKNHHSEYLYLTDTEIRQDLLKKGFVTDNLKMLFNSLK